MTCEKRVLRWPGSMRKREGFGWQVLSLPEAIESASTAGSRAEICVCRKDERIEQKSLITITHSGARFSADPWTPTADLSERRWKVLMLLPLFSISTNARKTVLVVGSFVPIMHHRIITKVLVEGFRSIVFLELTLRKSGKDSFGGTETLPSVPPPAVVPVEAARQLFASLQHS